MQIAHETNYPSLFVQARGALRKKLTQFLRKGRNRRHAFNCSHASGLIRGMINISERPAEADDRAVPGHWEGDLIMGKLDRSVIGTLVERKSRFVLLIRLGRDKTAQGMSKALAKKIKRYLLSSGDLLPGIRARKWLAMHNSPSSIKSLFISATQEAHGNAEQTRILTVCCSNTFPVK